MIHFPARLMRLRLTICAIAIALVTSACGDGAAADNTEVAAIGDRVLTQSGLDDLLPTGDATVAQRIANVVSTWLLTQALEFELADRGYEINEFDIADAEAAVAAGSSSESRVTNVESLTHALSLSLAVGRWADDVGEDIEPELPGYLCSSHLVVETEEEATAAMARYEAGEPFAELAMDLSTGPSGVEGGDLGCALEGSFVPEFEEAAYATAAGEVVGPVKTNFGWHLIEVHSVGPATPEFHPVADRQDLDLIAYDARQVELQALVFTFETEAKANFGDSVRVDSSIGTIDRATFAITVP